MGVQTRESLPAKSVYFHSFGVPALADTAPKVATKPLIVLAYKCLEPSASRLELARLFWPHLEGQRTKRGERKDVKNYGVVRATLKGELGIDIDDAAHVVAVSCDARLFTQMLAEGRLKEALELYRRGSFLQGVELQSRLHLSTDVLDWLDIKRAYFAGLAQTALLDLARDPRYKECATQCVEETHEAERGTQDLGLLSQLYSLLTQLKSPLAADAQRKLERQISSLRDELSPRAFRLYLALSLQNVPNLAAAQLAVNLSPRAGASCLEELRGARLVSAQNTVLSGGVAELYLEQHVGEKVLLLCELAKNTAAEQAFTIFQSLYETNHTFGGVGYWQKAREAYCRQAKTLFDARDFEGVVTILDEFERAETDSQKRPARISHASEEYALECLAYYQEAVSRLSSQSEL